MKDLTALVGAIVFAWLPEVENPHHPGPKFRPTLVIDTDNVNKRIKLAYGTSQKTNVNYAGEITFSSHEVTGLTKDTKFCIGKSFWIPMDNAYFTDGDKNISLLGFIPKNRAVDLLDRVNEVITNNV